MQNSIQVASTTIHQHNQLYSLNDLHKASGGLAKNQPTNWLRTSQVIDLIALLKNEERSKDKQNQEVIETINGGDNRGTFACKELVVHYGMWISPAFSLQVIQAFLDAQADTMPVLQPQYPPPRPTVTVEQQDFIRAEVAELSKRTGENPHSIYRRLKLFIGMSRYANIPFDDFERAIAFLHGRCYPPKYIIWEGQNNEPPENLTPLLHCSLLLARVWLETLRYPLCKLNPDANRISEFAKTVVITSQFIAKKYDIDMNVTDSLQFISEPFKH